MCRRALHRRPGQSSPFVIVVAPSFFLELFSAEQLSALCGGMNFASMSFASLENMYKELGSDIEGFQHPGHGDLTGWAKQGDAHV